MDYWWKLFSAYFLFLCLARRHFSTSQWMSSQKSSTAKNFFLLGPPHFSSFWLEGWQRFGYWLFNMETNAAAAATKQIQQMLEMQARAFVFLASWSWTNRKIGKWTIVNSIFISFFEKMKRWRKKNIASSFHLMSVLKKVTGEDRERVSCRPGLSVFQLDVDSAWPVPFYPHELAPNRLGAPVSIYDGKIQLTEFHVRIWRRESRRAEAQPQPHIHTHTHTQGEEASI